MPGLASRFRAAALVAVGILIGSFVQLGVLGASTSSSPCCADVATFTAPNWINVESSVTLPNIDGPFVEFDPDADEGGTFNIGSLIPDDWRTFDVYVEAFAFGTSTGDVVWEVQLAGSSASTTTVPYSQASGGIVDAVGGQTYSLGTSTVAGVAKYGHSIKISRLGSHADDTFPADMLLGAIHIVRVT